MMVGAGSRAYAERGFSNPVLRASYLSLAFMRAVSGVAARHASPEKWRIFYYHSVLDTQRRNFRRQVQAVAGRAVSTQEICTAADGAGESPVCLTFDDGFANLLSNALPTLAELKVPVTIFVVAGNLGSLPRWPIEGAHADAGERLMTASEIRSLPDGLVTIGSHTLTHRRLDVLPRDEAEAELRDSKRVLEDLVGKPVCALSFPHGQYSEQSIQLAYEAGYEQLFTIDACAYPGPLPSGLIGRFGASPGESLVEFKLKASGAYDWLHSVRRIKDTCVQGVRRALAEAVV